LSTQQQIPARAQRLHQLWRALPGDSMTEGELRSAILGALNRPGAGHEADVDAWSFLLTSSGSVTVRRGEDGQPSYVRAPVFPEHEPCGPGSEAFDRQTAELAEEEERRLDLVSEEAFTNSPQHRQQVELRQHVRALIREELPQMLGDAIRAELPALLRVEAPVLLRRHIDEAALRERVRAVLDSPRTPRRRPTATTKGRRRAGPERNT
jgi:hypothetical protein